MDGFMLLQNAYKNGGRSRRHIYNICDCHINTYVQIYKKMDGMLQSALNSLLTCHNVHSILVQNEIHFT